MNIKWYKVAINNKLMKEKFSSREEATRYIEDHIHSQGKMESKNSGTILEVTKKWDVEIQIK